MHVEISVSHGLLLHIRPSNGLTTLFASTLLLMLFAVRYVHVSFNELRIPPYPSLRSVDRNVQIMLNKITSKWKKHNRERFEERNTDFNGPVQTRSMLYIHICVLRWVTQLHYMAQLLRIHNLCIFISQMWYGSLWYEYWLVRKSSYYGHFVHQSCTYPSNTSQGLKTPLLFRSTPRLILTGRPEVSRLLLWPLIYLQFPLERVTKFGSCASE